MSVLPQKQKMNVRVFIVKWRVNVPQCFVIWNFYVISCEHDTGNVNTLASFLFVPVIIVLNAVGKLLLCGC